MKRILALLLLLASCFATIQLVTPKHIALESLDQVEISPVGPGQEVFLKFERTVGSYVWDDVKLINTVDPDWQLSTYKDYQYIYYSIRVPTSKASGRYTFQFEIRDNEGLKDPEIAVVQVVVTHDQDELIKIYPMPPSAEGFAAENIRIPFDIENKALAQTNYQVSASIKEMPGLGAMTISHSFLAGQSNRVYAQINIPEEGDYTLMARIWSTENPTISQTITTRLTVKPTFRSKLLSIGHGFPLVPMTMAPFYALLGVFGW